MKLRIVSFLSAWLVFIAAGVCRAQNGQDALLPATEILASDPGVLQWHGILPEPAADTLAKAIDPGDIEMSSRGGARVSLYLNDGSMMYGDLTSVADSAISLFVYRDLSLVYTGVVNSGEHTFAVVDVDRLVIKGKSRMLEGIFIGFLGGMVTGSVVTRVAKLPSSSADLLGPGGLGGAGLLVGGAAGCLLSGRDLEIRNFDVSELSFLKSLCRHVKSGMRRSSRGN